MKRDFIVSYKIDKLCTNDKFIGNIELGTGMPKVTQAFINACKIIISKQYQCTTNDIKIEKINVQ
jgi:hypothetical protein